MARKGERVVLMVEREEEIAKQIGRKTLAKKRYEFHHNKEGTHVIVDGGFENRLRAAASMAIAARILGTPENPVLMRDYLKQSSVEPEERKTLDPFYPGYYGHDTRAYFKSLARERLRQHRGGRLSEADEEHLTRFAEATLEIENDIVTKALENAKEEGVKHADFRKSEWLEWHIPHEKAEQAVVDAAVAAGNAAKGFGTGQTAQFREIVEILRKARAKPKFDK